MKRTWTIIGVADVARSLAWYQSHDHPTLADPDEAQVGHGLILFFRVDDFDQTLLRARANVATLEEEPYLSPNTGTREFALRDPDGYYVMVSALDGT